MTMTKEPSKHESFPRDRQVVGTHSARCKREKHEDWQHGWTGCGVGVEGRDHCDCTAHWHETPVDIPAPKQRLQEFGE